ncbi:MAG: PhnD/SsuA/transferrin family substrate-binding protein, partial [Pseudomonadota bacterium]
MNTEVLNHAIRRVPTVLAIVAYCQLALVCLLPFQALAQDDAAASTTRVMTEAEVLEWQSQPVDLLVNPIYLPEQAEMVYQPLVDYLRAETGLDIQLVTARNFHRYWLDARRDEASPLILEDAHMASWRMNRHGYEPLATTSTPTSYSLLTMGHFADDSLEDFVGRQISSLPSPSLGYVMLSGWFTNPLQQPLILSNATSWLDAIEIVFAGEADAA